MFPEQLGQMRYHRSIHFSQQHSCHASNDSLSVCCGKGGAKVLVRRCWRGIPQVKLLCAALLTDLCQEDTHIPQVVSSGAIAVFLHLDRHIIILSSSPEARHLFFLVRHGISELKSPCAAALSRLEAHVDFKETLRKERQIQQRITNTVDMLDRDHQTKLTPLMEEAIRMIPRSFFAPPTKARRSSLSSEKRPSDHASMVLSVDRKRMPCLVKPSRCQTCH